MLQNLKCKLKTSIYESAAMLPAIVSLVEWLELLG